MKTLFWKAYYKHKLGKECYENAIQSANDKLHFVNQCSTGNFSHFYNEDGQQIRGWFKRNYKSPNATQHPLITKYQ
jgi:hypothetical protein